MIERLSKPVDKAYLRRAALYYLQRYASSVDNLRRVLLRKAKRRAGPDGELPADLDAQIEEVIGEAMRMDLVDDRRFAEARVATLLRKGVSKQGLKARLSAKGVTREVIDTTLAETEVDDLTSARRLAERRRLGAWRPQPDPDKRDRDLGVLLRAGFSHAIARKALDAAEDD